MTTTTLDKLTLSPANVRQTSDNVDDLVASIRAHGLLNPLTVTAKGKTGFEVVAGGRRLRALQELDALGKGLGDIPITVIDKGLAEEASLAENFIRSNMTDLEILTALRTMTEVQNPERLQERFGVTLDRARRLLRLANLAPEVFERFKAGELSNDQAKAFASTSDHDKQREALAMFDQQHQHWDKAPHCIRRWLGMGDHDVSRMLRDVGREAYLAAGGQLEEDLFSDAVRVLDPILLEQLDTERRRKVDEDMAKQHNLPILTDTTGWHKTWLGRADYTGDEQDEARIAEIEDTLADDEELPDENREALEDELERLIDKRVATPRNGYQLAIYDGDFWEQQINLAERPASDTPAEAEPVNTGVQPSTNARHVLNAMRRERLIERSRKDAVGSKQGLPMLLFTIARTCFGQRYRHDVDGLSKVGGDDDLWLAGLSFMEEPDEALAYAAFVKAHPTEVELGVLAIEMVARLTQAHVRPDHPHIQLIASASKPRPWRSSPEFWNLWRKGDMLAMAGEVGTDIVGLISNMKQGDMREALHDLFGAREKIVWKNLSAETLGRVQTWVPQWLRFADEQEDIA